MAPGAIKRLRQMNRRPDELAPDDFETSAGQNGKKTVVAELQADTPLALREGRTNPIRLAIPVYESFTLAGDGTDQTFNLSNSITETAVTQDAVAWFAGNYQGTPKTINYAADSITVSGDGSGNTIHVFYISDDPATVTVQKANTDNNTDDLKTMQAGLVQQTDQSEQPEWFDFSGDHPLKGFIATDMTLEVTVEANYVTRFTDPNGDGAEATNALLALPIEQGAAPVEGLNAFVRDQMA
ncbi:MAG: hypothetical protein ACI8XM_000240 [Haloarculaceae archaeon]|jgi:hypothetical protein